MASIKITDGSMALNDRQVKGEGKKMLAANKTSQISKAIFNNYIKNQ